MIRLPGLLAMAVSPAAKTEKAALLLSGEPPAGESQFSDDAL
jgi:hypothetical protein